MAYRRGWFQEPHRHYLASKGIKTNRYYVRNELKGNRGSSLLHSLYAKGYSNPEIAQTEGLPEPVRNEAIIKLRSRRSSLLNVPDRPGGDAPSTAPSTIPTLAESASFSPLQSTPLPVTEQFTPAPEVSAAPAQSDFATIDAASAQEGVAPIESEGFEDSPSLAPLSLPEEQTAPVMTPGVPEQASFGMSGGK